MNDINSCTPDVIKTEILAIFNRKILNLDIIKNLNVDVFEDICNGMCVELRAYVFKTKLIGDEYKVNYSYKLFSTWWDHFKYSYMPKWFVKFFPIKYKIKTKDMIVKFSRYATYPKANIKIIIEEVTF